MSIPISACLVTKAANGDEQAYSKFKAAMLKNLQHGSFSTYPVSYTHLTLPTKA